MKAIKVYFEDFGEIDTKQNFIIDILQKDYQVIIDPFPDYLFFSVYGFKNYKHKYDNCIKIFYTCENNEPDFSICDYAIAFTHLKFDDRYIRFPWYLFNGFDKLNKNKVFDRQQVLNRKFCNFIYGDYKMADPYRKYIFEKIGQYKKIDSAGTYLNNTGKFISISKKVSFISDYKFTLAIENSISNGYTTEKIIHPMLVNSMPIYWGNPSVEEDFNKKSFICIQDFQSLENAIEEIIRLDNDNEAYISKLSQPWFLGDDYNILELKLRSFFKNIFEQPIENAKRTTKYGWTSVTQKRMEAVQWSWPVLRKFMKIRNFLKKW